MVISFCRFSQMRAWSCHTIVSNDNSIEHLLSGIVWLVGNPNTDTSSNMYVNNFKSCLRICTDSAAIRRPGLREPSPIYKAAAEQKRLEEEERLAAEQQAAEKLAAEKVRTQPGVCIQVFQDIHSHTQIRPSTSIRSVSPFWIDFVLYSWCCQASPGSYLVPFHVYY